MSQASEIKKEGQKIRKKAIAKVLIITLVLNLFVAFLKIIVGNHYHFLSLTSSGLESLVDGSTNILALLTISFASAPPDKDHNYGHHKAENLGSLVVAVLLLFSAYQIASQVDLKALVSGNFVSQATFSPWTIVSIAISMIISLFVSWYENREGKKYNSTLLLADASHTFGDFLISGAVLISLILSKFGYHFFDLFVGLLVTGYLVFLALKIVRMNINELLDGAPDIDDSFLLEIEKMDFVYDVHNFRVRGNEHWLHADFHVHLDPALSLVDAHRIGKDVEQRVHSWLREYSQNVDVLIHIEPYEKEESP